MTTLRDFIVTRETDIKSQIKALKVELSDLKIAKSALDSQGGSISLETPTAVTKTIKDMIRDALKSATVGLTSTDILTKIIDQTGRQIERTSLSPQLTRMKADGEVTLVDNLWFLADAPDFAAKRHYEEINSPEKPGEFSKLSTNTSYDPFGDDGDIDIEF
jgi:hypothetical protein